MKPERLVFVYNAENGFFNALMDSAHKVFSPATYACSLCRVTFGLTGMLLPWKKFLDGLDVGKVFLHRSEFRAEHPHLKDLPLPVIFQETGGTLDVLLSADEIKQTGSLDNLMEAVRSRLGETAPSKPEA